MISPFPVGDHKASIKWRARKHNKNNTEITQIIHKRSTAFERSVKYTEQKWKRYTTIIYILWESIGQKVFTKA